MTYEDDEWIIPNELLQSWAVNRILLSQKKSRNPGLSKSSQIHILEFNQPNYTTVWNDS